MKDINSSNKPEHPGFELNEQFFRAFWYPTRIAAKVIGMDSKELDSFLSGLADLNAQQATLMQEVLCGWKTAEWILEQQSAANGLDRQPK